jgi:hypothetical protein
MVCASIPGVSGIVVSQGDAGDCRTGQHLAIAIQGRLHPLYFFFGVGFNCGKLARFRRFPRCPFVTLFLKAR